MSTVNEKLTAIADAIRAPLGTTTPMSLDAMATAIPEIYDMGVENGDLQGYDRGHVEGYNTGYESGNKEGYQTGYTAGYRDGSFESYETGKAEGITEGIEQGKQAEYDAFWDAFQENGNRTSYAWAFSYSWGEELFKPKYDIILSPGYTGEAIFKYSKLKNIAEVFEERGLRFDTTLCEHMTSMFAFSSTVRVPEINCSNATGRGYGLDYTFSNATALKTIDKLIVTDKLKYSNTFDACSNLEDITFEGVIGKNIALAQSSKLTNASVQSIIDHLKDLTGATAQTLTLHATVKANLTEEQLATITGKNWSVA